LTECGQSTLNSSPRQFTLTSQMSKLNHPNIGKL
jgi:hypothetical protein